MSFDSAQKPMVSIAMDPCGLKTTRGPLRASRERADALASPLSRARAGRIEFGGFENEVMAFDGLTLLPERDHSRSQGETGDCRKSRSVAGSSIFREWDACSECADERGRIQFPHI